MSKIALIVSENRIDVLTELLAEIHEHNYTRAEHVVAHIRASLDAMANIKDGLEYEIDARADHNTSEQFNGKV